MYFSSSLPLSLLTPSLPPSHLPPSLLLPPTFCVKVHIYHGPKRDISAKVLADNDVVLSTYSIAEADYRKVIEPTKVPVYYVEQEVKCKAIARFLL